VSSQIITQQGTPVDDKTTEEESETLNPTDDLRAIAEDINDGIKGFRKFRNSIILKIGIVVVAIKTIDVVGKIVLENQRMKAKLRQDDKQS
jgi:hypothetical protein